MKKVAYVFLLAVFLPSLVLACLAIRSLRDQRIILERQQSLLYQGVADAVARQAQDLLIIQQQEFTRQVESLVQQHGLSDLTKVFDDRLRVNWPASEVGFIVTMRG